MIIARETQTGRIVSKLTDKSVMGSVPIRVQTVTAASMPTRLNIKTNEAQLRGPPGSADNVELSIDPTVWFLLALG